jgi:hypothetical protein
MGLDRLDINQTPSSPLSTTTVPCRYPMNEYFSDPPFPFFLAGHYLQQFSYFDAEFEKDQLSELKRSPKTCDA